MQNQPLNSPLDGIRVLDFSIMLAGPYCARLLADVGARLVLTTVIVLLSNFWLARFRYGPLEWLWRMATYAKWEPLRLYQPFSGSAHLMSNPPRIGVRDGL